MLNSVKVALNWVKGIRVSGKSPASFTLVEIAIVRVIIGLVVGGILVGQDLIKVAQLRRATSDLENVSTTASKLKITHGHDIPFQDAGTLALRFLAADLEALATSMPIGVRASRAQAMAQMAILVAEEVIGNRR